MENGPFRMGGDPAPTPRPATGTHSAQVRATKPTLLDEPEEQPEPTRRETARHHEPKRKKPDLSKKLWIIIGAVGVAVLIVLAILGNFTSFGTVN